MCTIIYFIRNKFCTTLDVPQITQDVLKSSWACSRYVIFSKRFEHVRDDSRLSYVTYRCTKEILGFIDVQPCTSWWVCYDYETINPNRQLLVSKRSTSCTRERRSDLMTKSMHEENYKVCMKREMLQRPLHTSGEVIDCTVYSRKRALVYAHSFASFFQ